MMEAISSSSARKSLSPSKKSRRRGEQALVPLLEQVLSSDSTLDDAPKSMEDWLMQGSSGGGAGSTKISSKERKIQKQKAQSRSRRRGRSPITKNDQHQTRGGATPNRRVSRSLEPKRSPKIGPLAKMAASKLSRLRKPISSASAAPIPSDYIDCIVSTYGENVDLCRDVFGLESSSSSPVTNQKLRVAYFRLGRQMMPSKNQNQSSSSSSPVSAAEDVNKTSPSTTSNKQKFQAVTKAYSILTTPSWKAYYEQYGLVGDANEPQQQQQQQAAAADQKAMFRILVGSQSGQQQQQREEEEDEANVSILRRNSWGASPASPLISPSASRTSAKNRRVGKSLRWNEEVEELVYHPVSEEEDDDGGSGDDEFYSDEDEQENVEVSVQDFHQRSVSPPRPRIPKKNTQPTGMQGAAIKHRLVGELNEEDDNGDAFSRDILDDFEASLDGLGNKIGDLVMHAMSDTEEDAAEDDGGGNGIKKKEEETNTDNVKKEQDEGNDHEEASSPEQEADDSDDKSELTARQLFAELTKPAPQVDANSRASAKGASSNSAEVTSTMVSLKTASDYQPRRKIKKIMKPKEKSVKINGMVVSPTSPPTAFDPFCDDLLKCTAGEAAAAFASGCAVAQKKVYRELEDGAAVVPKTVKTRNKGHKRGASVPGGDSVSTMTALTMRGGTDIISPSRSHVTGHETLLDFDASSVVESTYSDEISPLEHKLGDRFDFGPKQTLSFDDALNLTTDATTKGFLRLERYDDDQTLLSAMDTSAVTFMTNEKPMCDGLQGMIDNFAEQAHETFAIKHSLTGREATALAAGVRRAAEGAVKPKEATAAFDKSFFSTLNGCVENLVNDMSKIGSRVTSSWGAANQAVHDTIGLEEDEVGKMLEVLESEMYRPSSMTSPEDSLNRSFTF